MVNRHKYTVGADIIMQLDDVVHSTTQGPRVEEAMWRYKSFIYSGPSILWSPKCPKILAIHRRWLFKAEVLN